MNIFDQLAFRYDTDERIEITNIIANKMKDYLKGFENKTAIDLGCGTGLVGLQLSNYFKDIIFIDTSQNMINIVNDKIKELELRNAKALSLDINSNSSELPKVDCIFMAQVLIHVPEYKEFLSNVYNMLNKDGLLLIIEFDKNEKVDSTKVHNGFDRNELGKILKNIGFSKIYSETFYKGNQIFMKQDASIFILEAKK